MKLSIALSCLLIGAGVASAATITSFSAAPYWLPGDAGFNPNWTETINSTFDSNTGRITNSVVTCNADAPFCTGNVARFSIMGTGLFDPAPFTIAIDGNFNGARHIPGTVWGNPYLPNGLTFVIPVGDFSETIYSAILPSTSDGTFSFTGGLILNMSPGQTLTLPDSLTFTVGTAAASAAPEPGTLGLFGASLAAVVFAVRRRRA